MIQQPASVPLTNEVTARQQHVEDVLLTARLRSFTVMAASKLQFVFQNPDGLPYDLTDCEDTFIAEIRELVSGADRILLDVSIKTAAGGLLELEVPAGLLPGIYRGSVTLFHEQVPILKNPFRLYTAIDAANGIPTLQEMRLFIRDTYPEENLLLDGRAFSDEEIAASMERAIRYYNEVPPRLEELMTTQNFPYRHHLIEGTLGQLYLIAAEDCRKNSLQYQAGGLSVADKEKEANYQRAAQYHWQAYQQFVRVKKAQLNMESGWGVILSPYSYRNSYRR